MTGVRELRDDTVVSAAPEAIRVSVLGGRTQLDVALPADVPVAAFLPELAQLICSRDARDEETRDRDERRTFWVLRRVDGDVELAPEQTLRGAGIGNGALLRVSQQRALSPPTLYDDVVDAAARFNRAAYAAWDATAAGVMAMLGLWSCSRRVDLLPCGRGIFGAPRGDHRRCGVDSRTIVVGAAMAHRALGRTDIAECGGSACDRVNRGPRIYVDRTRYGEYGIAMACVVLLVLAAVYYRVIGTGHWAYIAAAVVFVFGASRALAGSALGGRIADADRCRRRDRCGLGRPCGSTDDREAGTVPGTYNRDTSRRARTRQFDDPFAPADDPRLRRSDAER